jgi:hypothetical protein
VPRRILDQIGLDIGEPKVEPDLPVTRQESERAEPGADRGASAADLLFGVTEVVPEVRIAGAGK